jgi:hypothetical protein
MKLYGIHERLRKMNFFCENDDYKDDNKTLIHIALRCIKRSTMKSTRNVINEMYKEKYEKCYECL